MNVELYNTIITELRKIEAIKWIDLDSGQLDGPEGRKALKYACALIRMVSTPETISEDSSVQRDNIKFTIRLAFDATGSRTSADTPETVRLRSLAWVTTAQSVYTGLQGFSDNGFSQFDCSRKEQERRTDGLIVFALDFNTNTY